LRLTLESAFERHGMDRKIVKFNLATVELAWGQDALWDTENMHLIGYDEWAVYNFTDNFNLDIRFDTDESRLRPKHLTVIVEESYFNREN
jgi:hypothetical protein